MCYRSLVTWCVLLLCTAWCCVSEVSAQSSNKALTHTLEAFVLTGRDTTITRDLRFGGYLPYQEGDLLQLTDENDRPLNGSDEAALVEPVIQRDSNGVWFTSVHVPGSLRTPGLRRIYVYEQGKSQAKVMLILPVRTPEPQIESIRVRTSLSAAVKPMLTLVPFRSYEAVFQIRGGPFYEGTTVEFGGKPLDVAVINRELLQARLRIPSNEEEQPNVGPQEVIIAHPHGTWRLNRSFRVVGPAPTITTISNGVIEAKGERETIHIEGRHFSDAPTIRISPDDSGLDIASETLRPDPSSLSSRKASVQVYIPQLGPGRQRGSFTLTLINEDNQAVSTTVHVRRPRTMLKVDSGQQPLMYGIRTPLVFEVLEGHPRFTELRGRHGYRLKIGDREIKLQNQIVEGGGDLLKGTVFIPEPPGDPTLRPGVDPVDFIITDPLGQKEWTGSFRIHARPRVADDTVVLRPGEKRTVFFEGHNLEGAVIRGDEVITVADGELDDEQVLFTVRPDATPGTVRKLPLRIHNQDVGYITVEIQAWAPVNYLMWTADRRTEKWYPWPPEGKDHIVVDRDAAIQFKTTGRALRDDLDQIVEIEILSDDAGLHQTETLTARKGEEYFNAPFTPSSYLQGGETFTIRIRSGGETLPDRTFYVKRRPGEKFSITAGLSALQVPLFDDERPAGLFDGVHMGLNYSWDRLNQWIGRDDAIAVNLVSALISRPGSGESGLQVGFGTGVLLFNKLLLGIGIDGESDSMVESTFFMVGASIDLGVLRSAAR